MNKFTVQEALERLADTDALSTVLIEHPAYDVRIYKPEKVDNQKPHTRDEVYVIASGTGDFVLGNETQSFKTGDLIFVPANAEHRFINFSDDFSAWVVFFGPAPT